jgi:hypothetical protein
MVKHTMMGFIRLNLTKLPDGPVQARFAKRIAKAPTTKQGNNMILWPRK